MQRNRSMLLAALLCGSAVMAPLHAQPLSTDSTIRDVLAQPAFQGFADRLLPWDDGREPSNLPLNRVAELMPYHSHIHPAEIVETLNHMAAQRARGEAVEPGTTRRRVWGVFTLGTVGEGHVAVAADPPRPA